MRGPALVRLPACPQGLAGQAACRAAALTCSRSEQCLLLIKALGFDQDPLFHVQQPYFHMQHSSHAPVFSAPMLSPPTAWTRPSTATWTPTRSMQMTPACCTCARACGASSRWCRRASRWRCTTLRSGARCVRAGLGMEMGMGIHTAWLSLRGARGTDLFKASCSAPGPAARRPAALLLCTTAPAALCPPTTPVPEADSV